MGKTDRELIRLYHGNGDPEAFAELVQRHARLILGVPLRAGGDEDRATAVMQWTFLSLIESAPRLARARKGEESLAGWLHRAAAEATSRAGVEAARASDPDSPWRGEMPRLDRAISALPEAPREAILAGGLLGLTPLKAAMRLDRVVAQVKHDRSLAEAALLKKTRLGADDFAALLDTAREEAPPPLRSQVAPVLAASSLGPFATDPALLDAGIAPEALALRPRRRTPFAALWLVAATILVGATAFLLKPAVFGDPAVPRIQIPASEAGGSVAPPAEPSPPPSIPEPEPVAASVGPELPAKPVASAPRPPDPLLDFDPGPVDREAVPLGFVHPAEVEKGQKAALGASGGDAAPKIEEDAAALARRQLAAKARREKQARQAAAPRAARAFVPPGRFAGAINVNGREMRFRRPEDFAKVQAQLMRRGPFAVLPGRPLPPPPLLLVPGPPAGMPRGFELFLRGVQRQIR